MALGGAGSTAAAVTAGGAAQQNDHVTGIGTLSADVGSRSSSDDSADLHTLGSVAGVVDFVHNTGSQTDLVAVGGVACSSGGNDLPLGQLAFHGFGNGLQRISSTGDTHSAVDIGSAGQGVTDGTADTGGSTAEGLNLGGMVVGLILKEQQPGLGDTVHGDIHLHGAGVDLFGFVQLVQLALGTENLYREGSQIHEADGLVLPV